MMKSLIRIFKGGLLCTGLALTVGYAAAQEPEEGGTDTTAAGPSTVEAAQRLKVEFVDEAAELTLQLPNPSLLEQRYVATIRLDSRWAAGARGGAIDSGLPTALLELFQRLALAPPSIAAMIEEGVELMPVEERPSKEIIDDLILGSRRNIRWIRVRRGDEPFVLRYEFLARNADRAIELARAFVAIRERGVDRKLQQVVTDHIELVAKEQEEASIAYEQAIKRSGELETEAQELGEIDTTSLADLRNHQRLVSVDIAGVRARIDACDRLLLRQEKGMREAQIEKLEDLKLTAEVDLVGLNARSEALSKIVALGEGYEKLQGELIQYRLEANRLSGAISAGKDGVARLKELREQLTLSVLDNEIVVQPIAWQPAEESAKK